MLQDRIRFVPNCHCLPLCHFSFFFVKTPSPLNQEQVGILVLLTLCQFACCPSYDDTSLSFSLLDTDIPRNRQKLDIGGTGTKALAGASGWAAFLSLWAVTVHLAESGAFLENKENWFSRIKKNFIKIHFFQKIWIKNWKSHRFFFLIFWKLTFSENLEKLKTERILERMCFLNIIQIFREFKNFFKQLKIEKKCLKIFRRLKF